MRREVPVPGKDFCDMSKPFSTPFEQYSIINAMLPTKYYPLLAGNIYERRAADAVAQLFPGVPGGMAKDYDQLLDKNPNKPGA